MEFVETSRAPKPLGHYSQAIVTNGLVFVSGIGPINPSTGTVPAIEIKSQTKQVIQNMKAVLEEAGSSLQNVAKVTVYLKDAAGFKEMNGVYADYFGGHKPARTTVVTNFVKEDFLVSMDIIAAVFPSPHAESPTS